MKQRTLQKGGLLGEIFKSREFSLMIVMALLIGVIQWRSGGKFLSATVITQLTQNYAYTMVLSFGMLLVLLIGGIDISIGATLALSGMSTSLLMRDGVISGGMIPKVNCCIEAIRRGVNKVFIIDGRIPHSILIEVLTDEGVGTMFVSGNHI